MQLRPQNTFSCGLLLSCVVGRRSRHAGHMWRSVSAYEAQSCPHIVNSRGQGAGTLGVLRGVLWDMGLQLSVLERDGKLKGQGCRSPSSHTPTAL